MATPDERAGRIRGNLGTRADRLSGNNNARAERIRGNLTARAQRQTKGLIEDLQALAVPERQPPRLSRLEPRGAILAARGYSEVNQQPGSGGQGGGLASPLIEGSVGPEGSPAGTPKLQRTYYEASEFMSSDGLFVLELDPVQSITLRDANGEMAEFVLANPYAAEDPAP